MNTDKNYQKLIEQFKKYNISSEQMKDLIYYGGDKGRHSRYYSITMKQTEIIEHSDTCMCGHVIQENCYVKYVKTGEIFVLGNCCIKRYIPKSYRTCTQCGNKHKNIKDNICKDCRKQNKVKHCADCNQVHKNRTTNYCNSCRYRCLTCNCAVRQYDNQCKDCKWKERKEKAKDAPKNKCPRCQCYKNPLYYLCYKCKAEDKKATPLMISQFAFVDSDDEI